MAITWIPGPGATAGADVGTSDAASDILSGLGGNDVLVGGGGNDILIGGTGNDTMSGGTGNDTFYVDSTGDKVIENASEGIDTVYSSVSYTLTNNVENLVLTGTAYYGYGNALNNKITGNGSSNYLWGGAGNDTISGGAGNDTISGSIGNDSMSGGLGNDLYYVDSTGDIVTENAGEGTDTISSSVSRTVSSNVENLVLTGTASNGYGNALNNQITGNGSSNYLWGAEGNDTISGGAGNDTISGGLGSDSMLGGLGNDRYYVDSSADRVTENAGEGTDTVYSSVSHFLSSNVENLILTGTAYYGYGNALNNKIDGNGSNNYLWGGDGNDTIFGGAGNDTLAGSIGNDSLSGGLGSDSMVGGLGNDRYVVDSTGDIVTENANEGIDAVYSSISYTLTNNVENLILTGTGAINGFGNALNNDITGNSSSNVVRGYDGNDYIFGLGGADTIYGGNGNDVLYGNDGADKLYGDANNDTLVGGAQLDSLYGGSGNDVYYVDTVENPELLTYVFDTVSESAVYFVNNIIVSGGIDTVRVSVDGLSGYTLTANIENLELIGNATKGNGNALNNRITGNLLNNYLYGAGGNDTIYGGAGNDTLGGFGNGTNEKDTLYGDAGSDYFLLGNDNSVFYTGDSANGYGAIMDFQGGTDKIVVKEGTYQLSAVSFNLGSTNADTGIYFGTELIGVIVDRDQSQISLTQDFIYEEPIIIG
ncbi:hemolysin-type calcium-binding region [Richelia sinica FACHB-800]|uniref:Hemolysin-type calcium-binding region n=1 Tax=Richelia sinica FACHB-800 TaxID=1357546 RepID=A0A975Y2S1_9NOST|nr:calcium-binding protein [Richelia sinica]MBD2667036.1 calcium-binding protein [Richelia sinica FACHB-800]QXE21375.1 hemolysin-type calcium-binding region [Richelia sinica FACHB-800]